MQGISALAARISSLAKESERTMKRELMKAAVLDVLSEFEHPVPERMIVLALKMLLRVTTTYADLRLLLKHMEEARLVVGITSEDETVVWSIRAEGKFYLLQ